MMTLIIIMLILKNAIKLKYFKMAGNGALNSEFMLQNWCLPELTPWLQSWFYSGGAATVQPI